MACLCLSTISAGMCSCSYLSVHLHALYTLVSLLWWKMWLSCAEAPNQQESAAPRVNRRCCIIATWGESTQWGNAQRDRRHTMIQTFTCLRFTVAFFNFCQIQLRQSCVKLHVNVLCVCVFPHLSPASTALLVSNSLQRPQGSLCHVRALLSVTFIS